MKPPPISRRSDAANKPRSLVCDHESHQSGADVSAATNGANARTCTPSLHSYLELGALPSAVPCARLHTRQVLWEWGLQAVTEPVELIVSELITNSVKASEGLTGSRYQGRWLPGLPPVRLWLRVDRNQVVVQVWDANHQMPMRQQPELLADHGRGFVLVETMSAEWGACALEGSSGKVVWSRVPT